MVNPTSIDCCTAGTYLSVKFLGEFEQEVEAFWTTYAITTGNDDRSTLEVVLGLLYVTVEHLHYIVGKRNVLSHIVLHHFTLVILVEDFLLHHTVANGCHLWTMFGVDDGGDDGTTESRTNLIELVFVVLVNEITFCILHLHVE